MKEEERVGVTTATEAIILLEQAVERLRWASGKIAPQNWWHEDVWVAYEAAQEALDTVLAGMVPDMGNKDA